MSAEAERTAGWIVFAVVVVVGVILYMTYVIEIEMLLGGIAAGAILMAAYRVGWVDPRWRRRE